MYSWHDFHSIGAIATVCQDRGKRRDDYRKEEREETVRHNRELHPD
jgi:hypothetical protein